MTFGALAFAGHVARESRSISGREHGAESAGKLNDATRVPRVSRVPGIASVTGLPRDADR